MPRFKWGGTTLKSTNTTMTWEDQGDGTYLMVVRYDLGQDRYKFFLWDPRVCYASHLADYSAKGWVSANATVAQVAQRWHDEELAKEVPLMTGSGASSDPGTADATVSSYPGDPALVE